MLVDHRYYHIKPGMVGAHLDLYEKNGFAPQTRHLGQPLAYMYTESGEVNTLVHVWCYEDAADRATKRAAMWKESGVAGLRQADGRFRLSGGAAQQPDDPGQIRADQALTSRLRGHAGARPRRRASR